MGPLRGLSAENQRDGLARLPLAVIGRPTVQSQTGEREMNDWDSIRVMACEYYLKTDQGGRKSGVGDGYRSAGRRWAPR